MTERFNHNSDQFQTAGFVAQELGVSREKVIDLVRQKGLAYQRRGKHRSYYVSLQEVRMNVNPNWRRRGWMTNLHGQ